MKKLILLISLLLTACSDTEIVTDKGTLNGYNYECLDGHLYGTILVGNKYSMYTVYGDNDVPVKCKSVVRSN